MFQYFFGRGSTVVWLLKAIVWLEIFALFYLWGFDSAGGRPLGPIAWWLAVSWLVLNMLDWIPWYRGVREKAGIRIHFQRNLVPVSYFLAPGLWLPLLGITDWFLLPVALFCAFLHHLDAIMLYLHFRDKSPMQPGYFSFHHYLREEEPTCTR